MGEREMTLQEWVERLPEIHAARREYAALTARLADPCRTYDRDGKLLTVCHSLADAEARLAEAMRPKEVIIKGDRYQIEPCEDGTVNVRWLGVADSAPAVGAAHYRLQAKADPYKWADFDAKLWSLIVVPADQP